MKYLVLTLALLLSATAYAQSYGTGIPSVGGVGGYASGGSVPAAGGATEWGWILSDADNEFAQTGDCGADCLDIMPDDANWTIEFAFLTDVSDASLTRAMVQSEDTVNGFAALIFLNYNDEDNSTNIFGEDGQEYEYPAGWAALVEDTAAWHFYTYVYDLAEDDFYIYVDGAEVLDSSNGGFAHSRASIDFIRFCGSGTDEVKGHCTELRIWDDIRTPGEVAAHDRCQMDCTDGGACPANLAFYYPVNDGAGALNEFVNGGATYDMTLQGTATWDAGGDEPFGGWTNSGVGDCVDDT